MPSLLYANTLKAETSVKATTAYSQWAEEQQTCPIGIQDFLGKSNARPVRYQSLALGYFE